MYWRNGFVLAASYLKLVRCYATSFYHVYAICKKVLMSHSWNKNYNNALFERKPFLECGNEGHEVTLTKPSLQRPAFRGNTIKRQVRMAYHMNSLQWAQNVGCRRKVAMNLCPLIWCTFLRIAPRRSLMPPSRSLNTLIGLTAGEKPVIVGYAEPLTLCE